ncbi:MAG: tRNA (guanosine(46)-N7)-methyltransferase TrmB [Treponema sp.]|nr:tRNA (guanosine(46)-N7)-methyltransferase TrmB [Treponema sp.]MDD7768455.1 tRNA (guanosine(46)-N7)-methyltransferase TrmB [Treponema sp.]MDY3132176.1 tRNA (guanosine(46)-N7)-methyltransferase TrmB [Treponema sp.]
MNDDSNDSLPLIKREVKTYVLRAGRMTAAQEKAYKELAPVYCIPFENKRINFVDIFGNTNPIIVEIGFGMGDATWQIAKANPNINYIGIEVHTPGVGKLLSEIQKNELKNLYIIEYDAMEVLQNMFGDNSINGFHIFFPDPWPKKKHHKRRMLQRPRTDLLAKKLSAGGYLYFVTDWLEYAEFALEQLTDTPGLKNKYEGFAEPQLWRNQTKFERKGMAADRVITEIFFEKK